jgi:hypothetical protein
MLELEENTDRAGEQSSEAAESADRTRKQRRVVEIIAVLVVVALAVVGFVLVQRAAAARELAQASDAWDSACADLVAVLEPGETAWLESEGRVSDEQPRTDLRVALDEGSELAAREPTDSVDGFDAATARAEIDAAEITDTTVAVDEAVAAWELEQATADATAARGELGAAIDAASLVLTESDGKVADNTVRQSLTDAINAANAAREAKPSDSVEVQTSDAVAAREHVTALDAARLAVTEAQAVWQAEQDRLAAEPAAAAAAATANASSSRSSSTLSGNSSSSSSLSSGSVSTTPPVSSGDTTSGSSSSSDDGSYWVETGENIPLCGDTSGNSWDC